MCLCKCILATDQIVTAVGNGFNREAYYMDANGLSAEQQALLASIMGKSSQAGGGGGFKPSGVPPAGGGAAPAPAAGAADSGKMLSQAEIDALIASMGK